MACELTNSVAHAYLDGELDAVRSAEFERHLQTCTDCAGAIESWDTVHSGLQRAQLREKAPARLRERVFADVHRGRTPAPVRSNAYVAWLAVAAIVLLAVLGAIRLGAPRVSGGTTPELAASLVDAHLRSLQPGHLMDVVSTDQHTVKPWFDGKIDFSPTVRDFADDGFPLEGGRLDVAAGRTVAALVYGRRKHIINVFVWPDAKADAAPQSGSFNGYQWIGWRAGGMEYYAVSDVNAADLQQLQALLMR